MSIEPSEQSPHPTNDSSNANGTNSGASSSKTIQSSFVHKLYSMLNDSTLDHLIKWSASLDSFIILPNEEFSKILSQFFKHTNISSFIRQLNMYGFHKVNDNNSTNAATSVSAESTLENDDLKDENDSEEIASSSNFWEFKHGSGNFKKGDLDSLSLIKRRKSRQYTMNHKISEPIPLRRSVLVNPFEGYLPPHTLTAPPSNLHPQFQSHPQLMAGIPVAPNAPSSKPSINSSNASDCAVTAENLTTGPGAPMTANDRDNTTSTPGGGSIQQQNVTFFPIPATSSQPANLPSPHGGLPPPNLIYPRSDYPKHASSMSFPVSGSVGNNSKYGTNNAATPIPEHDNIITSLESSVQYLHESHSRLASKNTFYLESLKSLYNNFIQMIDLIQKLKPDEDGFSKEDNKGGDNKTAGHSSGKEVKLVPTSFEQVNRELQALKTNLEQQSQLLLQDDKPYKAPTQTTSNYFSAHYQSSAQEINGPNNGGIPVTNRSSISSQSVYLAPSKFNSLFGAKTSRGRTASTYFDPLAPVSTPTSPSANIIRKNSVCGPHVSTTPSGTTPNPPSSTPSPTATLKEQAQFFQQSNFLPPPPNHPNQQIPPSSHPHNVAIPYSASLPYGSVYSNENNVPSLKQSGITNNNKINGSKVVGNGDSNIHGSNKGERPGSPSVSTLNASLPPGPSSSIPNSSLNSPAFPHNSNFVPMQLSRDRRPGSYPYLHGRNLVNSGSFNGGGIAEAMKYREGVINCNGNNNTTRGNQTGLLAIPISENMPFLHPQRRHTSSDVHFSPTSLSHPNNQYISNDVNLKPSGPLPSSGSVNTVGVGAVAGGSNVNGLTSSKSSNVLNLLNRDDAEGDDGVDRERKRPKVD